MVARIVPYTFNLFDNVREKVQLRDHGGEVLWAGFPIDGEINAQGVVGVVHSVTLPDGTLIFEFPQAFDCTLGTTFRFRPDMRVSN
jgi:hypothetical protein